MIKTDTIKQVLSEFEPTGLNVLESMDLLDRQDSKSFFQVKHLKDLLKKLEPDYYALDINGIRLFHYKTLYFDTEDLSLYHDHHNGKLNRYKVRYRKYCDSNTTFFEIKEKTNKERNIKTRIKVDDMQETLCDDCKRIIEEKTSLHWEALRPSLRVFLDRATFISKDLTEKATIDMNIRFALNGKTEEVEGLVIAEVKQGHFNPKSKFLRAQRQLKIYPSNVSKYCLGILELKNEVKHNRFKPRLLKINKVLNK